MPHFDKALARLAAHALGGRIRRDEIRVLFLKFTEAPHQRVVLGIADGGLVEHVIKMFVAAQFGPQPLNLLLESLLGHPSYNGPIATYRKAVLILNPSARRLSRQRPGFLQRTIDTLAEEGVTVSVAATTGPGAATDLAREALENGADLVLAAGGDGTINEVVNGMAYSHVPLGILPGGTANILAMELGLGCRMDRAARLLPACLPERIALGRVHAEGSQPRYFLLMAGAGLDAQVVNQVKPRVKAALGKGAYWLAGFAQLGQRLTEFEVAMNGRRFRASFALASRVRNYGGDLELARNASLTGPDFEVVLFEGVNPFRYLKYLGSAVLGRVEGVAGVTVLRTQELELTPGASPVYVQVDGELIGRLPARVEIVPNALTLLAPPDFRERIALQVGHALAPA